METYSIRQQKVSRLVQKELGEIFNRESRSLFPGAMITITVVRMSPDLALARVYLSIFTKGDKNVFLENVQNQVRSLRHELGKKIRHQIRKIPELAFFIDDSLDYIDNINSLLNK